MLAAAVLSAWLQYVADGRPHARAVVDGACPAVVVDGRMTAMYVRAVAGGAFPDAVCDAAIPTNAAHVRVGERTVAAPAKRAQRIIVIGDTGCRIASLLNVQACNDASAWPFARITKAVAAMHPDLVVHVGDYYYRETACPPAADCGGSPHGDNAAAWNADWFAPAAPLFASTPLVLARGNHEQCDRGGTGWFRYLDAGATTACAGTSAPFAIDLPGLRFIVFDSAVAEDRNVDPAHQAVFSQQFRAVARMARPDAWFVTHRPPYLNDDQRSAMGDALQHVGLVLSGHLHLFAAMNVRGYAPLVIQGDAGTKLDPNYAAFLGLRAGSLTVEGTPFGASAFGFAEYERDSHGWTLTLRDDDGRAQAVCSIAEKTATCR